MDALELLKADHQRVRDLFEQLNSEKGMQQRKMLFMNIRDDLEMHTYIEETVFYPVFAKFDETRQLVEHSYEEHANVKKMLQDISPKISQASPEVMSLIKTLQDNVLHHVSEEEEKLFPAVRKMMRRPEREQLGRHLQAAKQERTEVQAA